MAVVDWIPEMEAELSDGDSVVSYITSADIDSVMIHMFALSLHWQRDENGNFKWPVYVWLQKQKPEVFDITGIIRVIEKQYGIPNAAAVISLILCMGGNDHLPNFHNIYHDKLLSLITGDKTLLEQLFAFQISAGKMECTISADVYVEVIKRLYCPGNLLHTELTADQVRQPSIKRPFKDFKDPQTWMPPISALKMIAKLIQCQIDYMLTSWHHESPLPDFMSYGCIHQSDAGETVYNMGPDMYVEEGKKASMLILSDQDLEVILERAKVKQKKTKVKQEKKSIQSVISVGCQSGSTNNVKRARRINKTTVEQKYLPYSYSTPREIQSYSQPSSVSNSHVGNKFQPCLFTEKQDNNVMPPAERLFLPSSKESEDGKQPDRLLHEEITIISQLEKQLPSTSTPRLQADSGIYTSAEDTISFGMDETDTIPLADLSLNEIASDEEEFYVRKPSVKRLTAWTPVKSPLAKRLSRISTPRHQSVLTDTVNDNRIQADEDELEISLGNMSLEDEDKASFMNESPEEVPKNSVTDKRQPKQFIPKSMKSKRVLEYK